MFRPFVSDNTIFSKQNSKTLGFGVNSIFINVKLLPLVKLVAVNENPKTVLEEVLIVKSELFASPP